MRKQTIIFYLLLLGTLTFGRTADPSTAGFEEPDMTIFQHLAGLKAPVLNVTIETEFKELIREKFEEEYQPAVLSYQNDEGATISWTVELRSRGNVRKQVCYFPPVKIRFDKGQLKEKEIATSHRSLKLVNQCQSGVINEQYLGRELLTYQLYNVVTPHSLRVRPLHITYVDTGKKAKTTEMVAFVIEDIDELAERLGGQAVKREEFSTNMVEHEPLLTMAVFEYMVGNTDWAVGNLHNLELIKLPEYRKVIAVPYDFDYAGLVNTTYAVPAKKLPIEDVTQRLYRGPECSAEEAQRVFDFFLSLETDIMQTAENCVLLDERSRRDSKEYLAKFFEELQSPRSLSKEMQKQ